MEKHRQYLPDFVSSKKKTVAAHESHFEKYGKFVTYDKYTGKFRDFKNEWKFSSKVHTLLLHARRCDCECQVELTLLNLAHTMQDVAILKQKVEDVLPKNMFYYLTANFMQHRKSWDNDTFVKQLEEIYAKRSLDLETKNNDTFDKLLKELIGVPCFRRFLAATAKENTLIKILDLCLQTFAVDVDYVAIVSRINQQQEQHSQELDDIFLRLREFPMFYVNRVYKPLGFITFYDFSKADSTPQHNKFDIISPRYGRIYLPWKCKRVLFIALVKRDKNCHISKIPKDVLNIIIKYTEMISLPSARSFRSQECTDLMFEDKKKSCNLM